jgi:hypothetical protein
MVANATRAVVTSKEKLASTLHTGATGLSVSLEGWK